MKKEDLSASDARIGMHGRILRCPVGDNDNPPDCPLHEVRKWPLEERIAWLNSKSNAAIIELYACHINCLEHKLPK